MRSYWLRRAIHAFRFLACVLTSWYALTNRVDWRLDPDEGWVASDTCRLVDEKRMVNLLTMMGYEFREGRTSLAPEAQ